MKQGLETGWEGPIGMHGVQGFQGCLNSCFQTWNFQWKGSWRGSSKTLGTGAFLKVTAGLLSSPACARLKHSLVNLVNTCQRWYQTLKVKREGSKRAQIAIVENMTS